MDTRDAKIIQCLLQENEAFRQEYATHQRYEQLLEEFNRRPHLTTDEELERRKLQKLKLAGKDRMARMIFEYGREHPGVVDKGANACAAIE